MSNQLKLSFFAWMAENSAKFDKPEDYIYNFIQFLNDNELKISRVSLGGSALHPEIEAFGFTYTDEVVDSSQLQFSDPLLVSSIPVNYPNGTILKMKFRAGIRMGEAFKNSPIPVLWEKRAVIHIPIYKTEENDYPIIEDLRKLGFTEYYAQPLLLDQGVLSYISLASNKESGFDSETIATLKSILEIFAVGWLRFRQNEMISSLLALYLGPMAGPQVLAGKIRRGDVDTKEAIIWFSDIRDYTSISSNYPTKEVIQWLNDYYQEQISNIHKFGGEVLKIMGDGMLAIFPTDKNKNIKTMAGRAIIAYLKSRDFLKKQNEIKLNDNKPIISHGIALHHGIVQYGNIGSEDRLDFTIIGNDVNLTSRISSYCGKYQRDLLLSDSFAKLVKNHTCLIEENVSFKGLSKLENIYSLSSK